MSTMLYVIGGGLAVGGIWAFASDSGKLGTVLFVGWMALMILADAL